MNPIYSIVFIVLGWLLGLLGPHLIELIQKPYRRKIIRDSLFIEMEELSRKLAASVYLIYDQRGMIDRAFLDWIRSIMGSYKRRHATLSLREQSDRLLALTDDQIRVLFQPSGNNRQHYTLKKSSVPFLKSQITNLYQFTPEFQRLALGIQAKVEAVNEEIDKAWFNYTKTFESGLSPQNQAIVEGNMHQANMNTAKLCREVCDDITELLSRSR
jgi:hypothetical protein